ncbi:MAG: phenylalanine--tRNA ligase subunit alpha [Actinobacteria bacterium 13_1_20CM_3_68_9]|nr:MAG: phenylalanine--tRNA ligase subunit alpha [Actinobacteria bacterium 13_1_20CM_3_68_9]
MADAQARIEQLRSEAEGAIAAVAEPAQLEQLRVRYLGRKAELTGILRGIRELPASERGPVGAAANDARQALERLLEGRRAELEAAELERGLASDQVDVTLPGTPAVPVGSRSLLTRTIREIEDVFVGLGYRVMEGPEVELDYYNFTALNHPPGHPARMAQDTFYVDPMSLDPELRIEPAPTHPGEQVEGPALPPGPEDVMLRTHTSPMQVRAMEAQEPPIFIVVPGRCYRSDPFDATHSPIFHQVEGLAVAETITLADLKGTLDEFARALFGPERETRFRPGFFPFTEPSVEVDVSCFRCGGSGALPDGSRDSICKGTGWIEILGSGIVDPNVFGFVEANGYDPERIQGFAFGMGIERIAMLKHGVPDLRKFFENDVRVLEQFR